jgi:3'-phosphoadenosine 5'-phosphosulfate sulfotransferase (PAPS reductase)/FAD synthetase
MLTIQPPPEITTAYQQGAQFVLSISGGKDSQAMTNSVLALFAALGWDKARLSLFHADVGRMDWHETLAHNAWLAAQTGLPLTVRTKANGDDLLTGIEHRLEKLAGTGKPFWPSAAARYCTKSWKTQVWNAWVCEQDWPLVISLEGIRAQESPDRAKKNPLTVRGEVTTTYLENLTPAAALAQHPRLPKRQGKTPRLVLNWFPIFSFDLDTVWQACGSSSAEIERRRALYRAGETAAALEGALVHPGYIYGSSRISCQLCPLAKQADLRIGAQHRPELWQHLREMEVVGQATFKNGWSLAALAPDVPGGLEFELTLVARYASSSPIPTAHQITLELADTVCGC